MFCDEIKKNLARAAVVLCFLLGCSAISRKAEFIVLYSNDVLGELENCGCDEGQLGGLSRRARVIHMAEQEKKAFLRTDAGNLFFNKAPANEIEAKEFLLKAEYILAAYNRMGYDAINIGEADFFLGLTALTDLRKKASFPFVSSNIADKSTGGPVFEQVVFKEVSGLTVGIVGLCPKSAAIEQYVRVQDPVDTAKKLVPAVRKQCDFMVILSGLGLEADRVLAQQVPGIDLIVAAKADSLLRDAVREGATAIVQAYTRGQYVGRLDIAKASGEARPAFTIGNVLIPLKEEIGEDKDIISLAKEYKARVFAMNKQEFFKAKLQASEGVAPSGTVYTGEKNCRQCHAPQYENWLNTFHARAYATLAKNSSHYDIECLSCHTTGYGEQGGYAVSQGEQSPFRNVQCESCHGPGSRHTGEKSGIVRDGGRDVCLGCHNEKNSPKFDYEEYLPMVKCPVT
ncbi:MAG: multiheme c-type cytochrome [Pseudomonadota bacterium]